MAGFSSYRITFPTLESCSNVLFTDECAVHLGANDRNTFIWFKQNPHSCEEGEILGPWHSVDRLSVGILGDRITDSHKRAVKSEYFCVFHFFSHLTQNQFIYAFFNLQKLTSDVMIY